MEYAAMLSSPDLVSGLRDLLADSDVAVVKRTMRVFANVYRHALRLLAAGDLDEATFSAAWPAMRGVADHILGMLPTAENEGITVHVVRFLEAALVAHLLSDVTRYPEVAAHGPKMVSKGVAALTGLISTPYIGGSAFLVAVRALITVACYKPDLWGPVTNLIERQIASPPPTLFDHNVRSLHKTLQRNLFRLLRRADTPALRSQLIEMMVTSGVPRRMLSQWAPPTEARKRPAQPQTEDAITGRSSPPTKRPRSDDDDDGRRAAPRDPREGRTPRDPRINGHLRDPREPRDPRTAPRGELRQNSLQDPRVSAPGLDTAPSKPTSRPNTPPASGTAPLEPQPTGVPATSRKKKEIMSNFDFLKSLITNKKKASSSFLESCSEKERALYERLDHPSVVRLVLSCLDSVPDSPPEDLLGKLGRNNGDVAGIREQLTKLLAPHIHADFISSLAEDEVSAPTSRPSSNSSSAFSARATPPHSEPSPPSPPSSARSTPSDPAQVCHSDVDLRHLLNRGFHATGDVDMRDTRNLVPREPPATHSRGAPQGSHYRRNVLTSNILDPRIAMPDPRHGGAEGGEVRVGGLDPCITQTFNDSHDPIIGARGGPEGGDVRVGGLDPRITQTFSDSHDPIMGARGGPEGGDVRVGGLDPRITQAFNDSHDPMMGARGGPFMEGSRPPYMGGHPTPPHGYMPGAPHGYVEGARPPFLEGGGGMVGVRHGFDMPPYEGQYPGPPMSGPVGGPHQDMGFMGTRGMMAGGPRGMGGPWQGGGAPHNRMGVMMPLMNGGSGMFSPPMHL